MDVDGFLECYKKTIIAYSIEYMFDEIKEYCESIGETSYHIKTTMENSSSITRFIISINDTNTLLCKFDILNEDTFKSIEPITLSLMIKTYLNYITEYIKERYDIYQSIGPSYASMLGIIL